MPHKSGWHKAKATCAQRTGRECGETQAGAAAAGGQTQRLGSPRSQQAAHKQPPAGKQLAAGRRDQMQLAAGRRPRVQMAAGRRHQVQLAAGRVDQMQLAAGKAGKTEKMRLSGKAGQILMPW